MPKPRVHTVDNISDKEAFDGPIDRYYRNKPSHRAKDVGKYDIDRLYKDYQKKAIKSVQEFMISSSGLARRLFWTNLIFNLGKGVFIQATVKTNNYGSSNAFEGTYTLNVTSPTAEVSASEIQRLLETYGTPPADEKPAYYMLRDARDEPVSVDVDENASMTSKELDLHYGEDFAPWAEVFIEGLKDPGLSILQGKPGTGKTSFLRYVISQVWETHRFYYVPVESFGLLSSSMLPEIWTREERHFPNAVKVLVLEDAERLLLDRKQGGGEVSSLLNLTDGLIGDLVKVHLICTINCDIDAIDEAVLRPGRQKFYKEFEPLSEDRSTALASHLGIKLAEAREHTLAEIYHHRDISRKEGELKKKKEKGRMGF